MNAVILFNLIHLALFTAVIFEVTCIVFQVNFQLHISVESFHAHDHQNKLFVYITFYL